MKYPKSMNAKSKKASVTDRKKYYFQNFFKAMIRTSQRLLSNYNLKEIKFIDYTSLKEFSLKNTQILKQDHFNKILRVTEHY